MSILSGTRAPVFHTIDIFGNPIDLAAYQGKPLLLSFFRNAACALCNLRVHMLIERYADYHRAGLEMVVIFESTAASMRQYVGRQDVPFPLIADPEAHLYTLYGVEISESKVATTMAMSATQQVIGAAAAQGFHLTEEKGSNFLRMPADFFIGPDGLILDAHYADYIWDHMSFARIEELLGGIVPG
ncbi:MAG: peroxiredoxin-like family protein [Kouleothrix sp.]